MRSARIVNGLSAVLLYPSWVFGAVSFVTSEVEVGTNLQTSISIRLSERAPEGGMRVTVRSDDPHRFLLAKTPTAPGETALTLELRTGLIVTPEFWIQGIGEPGVATYTVTADGCAPATGKVRVTPSALVIIGPFRAPSFSTTPRSPSAKISVFTARLDASFDVVEEQQAARTLKVRIKNSDPSAGAVTPDVLEISVGSSSAIAEFKPAALGKSTLTVEPVPGFSVPAKFASVTALVEKPGLAVAQELVLGKDLQAEVLLCLGEPAPPGGLDVQVTSADPNKMVISDDPKRLGSGAITVKVPAGRVTANFVLQALADAGKVAYRAASPGFRSALAVVTLTKAGVILAYAPYGPPDEAAVLRKSDLHDSRHFSLSLAEARQRPPRVRIFTGYIDPASGRIADMTVQPLRAGVAITVELKSSNPAVAKVQPKVTIESGHESSLADLIPVGVGEATLSVSTPPGFGTPQNATSVPLTVRE